MLVPMNRLPGFVADAEKPSGIKRLSVNRRGFPWG